jgi:hypothetical protein
MVKIEQVLGKILLENRRMRFPGGAGYCHGWIGRQGQFRGLDPGTGDISGYISGRCFLI